MSSYYRHQSPASSGIRPSLVIALAVCFLAAAFPVAVRSGSGLLAAGLLTVAVAGAMVSVATRLHGVNSKASAIIPTMLIIVCARPQMIPFAEQQLAAAVFCISIPHMAAFCFNNIRYDYAAAAAAIAAASSLICPPLIWILPAVFFLAVILGERRGASAAAAITGVVLLFSTAAASVFLAGGRQSLALSAAKYLDGMTAVKMTSLSLFTGWAAIRQAAFLLFVGINLVRSFFMCMSVSTTAYIRFALTTATFIAAPMIASIFFAGSLTNPFFIPVAGATSALFVVTAAADRRPAPEYVALILLAAATAAEAAARFIPQMNAVFS